MRSAPAQGLPAPEWRPEFPSPAPCRPLFSLGDDLGAPSGCYFSTLLETPARQTDTENWRTAEDTERTGPFWQGVAVRTGSRWAYNEAYAVGLLSPYGDRVGLNGADSHLRHHGLDWSASLSAVHPAQEAVADNRRTPEKGDV